MNENQKARNDEKWKKSKMYKEDLSGKMPWCLKCNCRTERNTCTAPQSKRDLENLCARAYNVMKRQEV